MPSVPKNVASARYREARELGFSADQARRLRTVSEVKFQATTTRVRSGERPAAAMPEKTRYQHVIPSSTKVTDAGHGLLRVTTTEYPRSKGGYPAERVDFLLDDVLKRNTEDVQFYVRVWSTAKPGTGQVLGDGGTHMISVRSRAMLLREYGDLLRKLSQSFPFPLDHFDLTIIQRAPRRGR